MRSHFVITGLALAFAVSAGAAELPTTQKTFEVEIQQALSALQNQIIETNRFSEKSPLFMTPPPEAWLKRFLSIEAFFPGARIRCQRIDDASLLKLEIDYQKERAKATVKFGCISGDKAYGAKKQIDWQKQGGTWFLSWDQPE